MKTTDFNKIFFALLFFHLVLIYKPESQLLYNISKPLLLFSLLAFFIHKNSPLKSVEKTAVAAALLFSLAGDVLLMQSGELFFLGGMGAFFAAHVSYVTFYSKQKLNFKSPGLLVGLVISAMAFWALVAFVNSPAELNPYLYAYAGILSLHLIVAAVFSFAQKGKQWLSALGAFLFLLSDFLLAWNKFNEGSMYLHLAIMLTYGMAQYCIVISINDYLRGKT